MPGSTLRSTINSSKAKKKDTVTVELNTFREYTHEVIKETIKKSGVSLFCLGGFQIPLSMVTLEEMGRIEPGMHLLKC